MGTTITFKRPDGKDASGYLANAARGNAPGVVVIQEWWGLSDQIKSLCDRFALAGFDETGSLEPLRAIPTLVLTGDADTMIPKEHSELIVERLPEAEFVVVPDAGHMVLLEKPDVVSEALTGLLRRVTAHRTAGIG